MNKIFRYAKIAIATLVTVAMGACTSDYEYDTPEALKGAQVYFSNTLPSKIEVNKESGNFDVMPMLMFNIPAFASILSQDWIRLTISWYILILMVLRLVK